MSRGFGKAGQIIQTGPVEVDLTLSNGIYYWAPFDTAWDTTDETDELLAIIEEAGATDLLTFFADEQANIASPDSDYDVRFIYVRDKNFYLSLRDQKDFIDWELNDVLDINGWDMKKALQHFHKSNATLFEWSNSPVVYYTTDEWQRIYEKAKDYFACKSALYHYYGTANKNYHEYLTGELVKYKKYFYVLRPILACKWIEEKKCPPPVLFDELRNAVLEVDMKPAIEELLAKKIRMSEADKAPKIDLINRYIEEKLDYYKAMADTMADDRKTDWEPLEKLFIDNLNTN